MHVLVIGDDNVMTDPLVQNLRRNGHDADTHDTGAAALATYHHSDVVLLDLELADLDALEVCKAIRSTSEVPIITVTGSDDELHRVLGLQAGSDDCLVKPFGFRELMARIEAVMRRVHPRPAADQTIAHGPLTMDPENREVRLHGDLVELTRKEFDLLHLLASRIDGVVSRKEIMARVWGHMWTTSSRTLDMHISGIRKKLGAGSWIITVRGLGFRFGGLQALAPKVAAGAGASNVN